MYLVTDINTIAILHEHPLTLEGYQDALIMASTLAQYPENHPSGIMIERRMPDNSIKQIIRITAP